jgi:hypothetical protein
MMITRIDGTDSAASWPVTDEDGEPVALASATFEIDGPDPVTWTTEADPTVLSISGDNNNVIDLRVGAANDALGAGVHAYALTAVDADGSTYLIEAGTLRVRDIP